MTESGSFLKGLFLGRLQEELLFPYPQLERGQAATVARLLEAVRDLRAGGVDSAAIDEEEALPAPLLTELRQRGFFGLNIPPALGGLGLAPSGWCRAVQELARLDGSLALLVGNHLGMGVQGLLLFGSPAQRERWLPRCASGEVLATFALSERGSGSDAAALQTQAELLGGGAFRIEGHKAFVTAGAVADLFTVFARVPAGEGSGITAFLLPRDEGTDTAHRLRTVGLRGTPTSDLRLHGVQAGGDQVLGARGAGFRVAVEILNRGRVAIAAGCIGQAQAALALAQEHAAHRRAFGRPLAEFGMIQQKLGEMVVDLFAMESVTYLSAGLLDGGRSDVSMECAAAKVFASEASWRIVQQAVQVAGGQAYLRSSPFDRLLRDARVNLVLGGTNEVLRMHLALSGLAAPLEMLRNLAQAVRRPLRSAGLLADYALDRFNRRFRRDPLTLVHAELLPLVPPVVDLVADFAQLCEATLRELQEEVLERQFVQRRMADIVVDLYVGCALLSRCSSILERGDHERGREALGCARVFLARMQRRVRRRMKAFEDNEDPLLRDLALNSTLRGMPGRNFD